MHDSSGLPPDLSSVVPLTGRRVRLRYSDDTTADVDLTPLLQHPLHHRVLTDDTLFNEAHINDDGTIAWPNGTDIAPEVLHHHAFTH